MANDINIRIGAKLDNLQRGISKAQRQLGRFADFAERVGTNLTTRLSVPVVGVGTAAVSAFARFEKLENGLKAIASEGEDAGETLSRLQKIAQLPGISLEQAVKGANQLRNVGFEAQQAEAILTELSKAVTLSGEGPEQLQSVVRQLVQMSAKGRILQEDLGVIQENVPSIGIAIQDAFGTQNIEAIRKSGVSAQEFTARITQAIAANEKFQNVQGGLANEFDNFRQSVTLSLATLGKTIAESINLSGILQKLSGFISRVTERFRELSPGVQKFIVIAAGIAAAIGPVVLGLGAIVKVALSVVAAVKLVGGALLVLAANPVGIAVAAIGGLVALFIKAFRESSKFRATITGIIAVFQEFGRKAFEALALPVRVLGDLLTGDLRAAAERVQSVFGADSGKSAGDAFASAYAQSIAKTAARNNSGGRIGASGRGSGATSTTPDLDAVFASVPSGLAQVPQVATEAATAVEEIEINFNRTSRAVGTLTQGLTRDLSDINNVVQVNASTLSGYTSFIGEYLLQIDAAAQRNSVLGDSFSLVSEKIQITKQALTEAIDTFGVNSAEVEELTAQYQALNFELDNMSAQQERIEALAAGIENFGQALGQTLAQGAISFKSFASAAIGAIGELIGALIKQGVAAAVASAIKSSTFLTPLGQLAIASATGTAASAIFRGLLAGITAPKLASGGIIPPGFEGDRFPAFLNSGEAVIPLDRLFRELNGGGGGNVRFEIQGSALVGVLDRAQYNSSRINGF